MKDSISVYARHAYTHRYLMAGFPLGWNYRFLHEASQPTSCVPCDNTQADSGWSRLSMFMNVASTKCTVCTGASICVIIHVRSSARSMLCRIPVHALRFYPQCIGLTATQCAHYFQVKRTSMLEGVMWRLMMNARSYAF